MSLLAAGRLVKRLKLEAGVRNRIQLAIAGAAEMAGYLSRWDRFHPKAVEAIANHHFSTVGLSVEVNLLGRRGRGTLRRRLKSSLSAADWVHSAVNGRRTVVVPRRRPGRLAAAETVIVCGSSSSQRITDRAVRLVITDPPYYDAVQYGELGMLFLIWARAITGERLRWQVELDKEAVPNGDRGIHYLEYLASLRTIFRETARTLARGAKVLLTYHSTDFRGWAALGMALHDAGLRVVGLAVAHSENETDHTKRGRKSFTKDLVLECQKSRCRATEPKIAIASKGSESRELIAAGRAIALAARNGTSGMVRMFRKQTERLSRRRIEIVSALSRDGGSHV
jgi:adenine-specific DNA methylase